MTIKGHSQNTGRKPLMAMTRLGPPRCSKQPFNLPFQPENLMPLQKPETPFEAAESRAFNFITNLLCNTAITEVLKNLEEIRLEGGEIARELRESLDSDGPVKEELTEALKFKIADRQFLIETIMSHPIEENV